MKVVRILCLVFASRSLSTRISFSGQAIAHRSHAMQSVSPVSGLLFSAAPPGNAPRPPGAPKDIAP